MVQIRLTTHGQNLLLTNNDDDSSTNNAGALILNLKFYKEKFVYGGTNKRSAEGALFNDGSSYFREEFNLDTNKSKE